MRRLNEYISYHSHHSLNSRPVWRSYHSQSASLSFICNFSPGTIHRLHFLQIENNDMKSWIIIRLSTESHTNTANQLLTGALARLRRIKVAMNVIMILPGLSPLQNSWSVCGGALLNRLAELWIVKPIWFSNKLQLCWSDFLYLKWGKIMEWHRVDAEEDVWSRECFAEPSLN